LKEGGRDARKRGEKRERRKTKEGAGGMISKERGTISSSLFNSRSRSGKRPWD